MATISLPSAQESRLEALAALPLELALREAVPYLVRLSGNPAFLNARVVPLLQEARKVKDWYVAYSCNGQDDSSDLLMKCATYGWSCDEEKTWPWRTVGRARTAKVWTGRLRLPSA